MQLNCDFVVYKQQRRLVEEILSKINLESVSSHLKSKLNIEVKTIQKLSTNGVINFIYLLTTTNNKLILRVSNPHPSWKKTKTAKQVVLLKLIKDNTNIPVPEIIDYQINQNNCPLKCQYILTQYIENDGTLDQYLVSLKDSPNMPEKYKEIIKDGISIVSQISKIRLNNQFIAGTNLQLQPIGMRWDGPSIGPFQKISQMIAQGLKISISQIQQFDDVQQIITALNNVKKQIETGQIDSLIKARQFVWKHGDLHQGNLSVKNGKINGVYDWQASRTGLLEQWDRQYDVVGWFSGLNLSQQSLKILQQYQNQLLSVFKIVKQPNWCMYKKYFQIMFYSFWSWFYSVTWWSSSSIQEIPKCIQSQKQANLKELKRILTEYGYL